MKVEESLRHDLVQLLAQRAEVDEKIVQTKAALAAVIAVGKEAAQPTETDEG